MKTRRIYPLLVAAVLLTAALACSLPGRSAPETVPPPVAPTYTPQPTYTPLPTYTPQPTHTPLPTATSLPAATATTASQESPTPTPTSSLSGPVPEVRREAFASYNEVPYTLPAAYQGASLPVDLEVLGNGDRYEWSDAQRALLAQNGFVVEPAQWREFYAVYEETRYADLPVFVTTDSVYHVYHLLFDKMLRDLERDRFEPDIRALTAACLDAALELYAGQRGGALEAEARSVVAYFAVAQALIEGQTTAPPQVAGLDGIDELVDAELALIAAHQGLVASPTLSEGSPEGCDPCDPQPPAECLDQPGMCEDYSQYVPRGHYTRSEQLQRYFRTMMWYGRINLRLQRPYETRMALLITYILRHAEVEGVPAGDVWSRIYDPTAFIVGQADDLGFHEYGALWDAVFGPDAPPAAVADEAQFAAFVDAARQLPPPQINSMWVYIWEDKDQVTQGFRFMGQRFVLDAYIFEQLTWREVGTMADPRMLPKALDVMAALGSQEAYALLDEMGETEYANYPEQMDKVRTEISMLQLDSWTQNLYWSWLFALQPLLIEKDSSYPAFMQTPAWTRKELHTALGSWTELKHDTILYAKQVMAEMGGGGPMELPRGWVEPNPGAYARLLALAGMTREGLESRGLIEAPESGWGTANVAANLMRLEELLSFLLRVSNAELAGEPLSDDDYARIHYYGGELEAMTLAAADTEGEGNPFFENQQAALVADVATDPTGSVLEEAIGRVDEIYVVVPDGRGGLNVARGGVFSYYEFAWPMSDRLTDESWQAMLDQGNVPQRPGWTSRFVAP